MTTLIFLLIFFFVLLPLGRVAWAVWRQYSMLRKQMRQAEAFGEAFRARQQQQEQAASGHKTRKKKIGRDVGEYVAFEEMRVYTASESTADDARGTTTRVAMESQVEDAEWEEL
ncbi:MAG: hypothetical protein HDR90_00610 [Bacteroides sp.]|nr:hypothetical protein [Bacteroides sp.]MBD5343475.1 hypothetical protein [Bacteroides sp.]